MSPAARRLLQGTGLACVLLAGGLVLLPVLGGFPGGTGSTGPALRDAAPLPDLGEAPGFTLTDQRGGTYGSEDLRGSVRVVDFVFTRCPAVCPILSRAMARLQASTPQEVKLVSISVDPGHDTPEVLAAYADRHGADPDRWRFLTGGREEIWSLIRDGFKLLVADNPGDPANPIAHTPRLVLVDSSGTIRGFYDGTIPEEVEALERDVERLVAPTSGDP